MTNIDEKQAVEQVYARLADRFPDLPSDAVRLAVERAHGQLDGRPVRNYVPVLVERAAREMLSARSGPAQVLAST